LPQGKLAYVPCEAERFRACFAKMIVYLAVRLARPYRRYIQWNSDHTSGLSAVNWPQELSTAYVNRSPPWPAALVEVTSEVKRHMYRARLSWIARVCE
jgi:hypothetical protein